MAGILPSPGSVAAAVPPGSPSFGAFREAGIVLLAILLLALMGATYLFHRFTQHRQLQKRDSRRRRRRRRTRPEDTTPARSGGLPPKRPHVPVTLNSLR
ncbi:MAG: hypothetical protein MUC91_01770 [Verrucomicrobia bacterium]|jgi:hypothetical protein|nr:hypothetical protein [Verrucomicrobiota bacterium]